MFFHFYFKYNLILPFHFISFYFIFHRNFRFQNRRVKYKKEFVTVNRSPIKIKTSQQHNKGDSESHCQCQCKSQCLNHNQLEQNEKLSIDNRLKSTFNSTTATGTNIGHD